MRISFSRQVLVSASQPAFPIVWRSSADTVIVQDRPPEPRRVVYHGSDGPVNGWGTVRGTGRREANGRDSLERSAARRDRWPACGLFTPVAPQARGVSPRPPLSAHRRPSCSRAEQAVVAVLEDLFQASWEQLLGCRGTPRVQLVFVEAREDGSVRSVFLCSFRDRGLTVRLPAESRVPAHWHPSRPPVGALFKRSSLPQPDQKRRVYPGLDTAVH